jgi:hypothetical protein
LLFNFITSATIYGNAVLPAKAGIQNEFDWMPDRVQQDTFDKKTPLFCKKRGICQQVHITLLHGYSGWNF